MATSPFNVREPMTGATIDIPANTYTSASIRNVRKSGNVATINFAGTISSSIAGSGAIICTLPEGFRPSVGVDIPIWGKYGGVEGFYNGVLSSKGKITTNIGSQTLTGGVRIQTTIIL